MGHQKGFLPASSSCATSFPCPERAARPKEEIDILAGSSSAPRLWTIVSPLNTTCHRLAVQWARLSLSGSLCATVKNAGPVRRFRLVVEARDVVRVDKKN